MRKPNTVPVPSAPGHLPAWRVRIPDDLGYMLRQAAGAHRLRMDRALADLAMTPPQFLVLTLLAAHPGQSSADLARMALLTTPTVSVIVNNLERMGALVRRPHAVHGRIQHLDLSPLGVRLLAAGQLRAGTVEAELTAGLSTDEASILRRWLLRAAASPSLQPLPNASGDDPS